jgi:hypothetical protein
MRRLSRHVLSSNQTSTARFRSHYVNEMYHLTKVGEPPFKLLLHLVLYIDSIDTDISTTALPDFLAAVYIRYLSGRSQAFRKSAPRCHSRQNSSRLSPRGIQIWPVEVDTNPRHYVWVRHLIVRRKGTIETCEARRLRLLPIHRFTSICRSSHGRSVRARMAYAVSGTSAARYGRALDNRDWIDGQSVHSTSRRRTPVLYAHDQCEVFCAE